MKRNKRLVASIIEIILGLVLIGCSAAELVDAFWSGMGTALIFVGALFLFRQIRYSTNAEYKEQIDVAQKDERNKFLAMKAWAWTGYLFVLIAGVSTIVLKILGLDTYMLIASSCVCLIVGLYWICYWILRKKY